MGYVSPQGTCWFRVLFYHLIPSLTYMILIELLHPNGARGLQSLHGKRFWCARPDLERKAQPDEQRHLWPGCWHLRGRLCCDTSREAWWTWGEFGHVCRGTWCQNFWGWLVWPSYVRCYFFLSIWRVITDGWQCMDFPCLFRNLQWSDAIWRNLKTDLDLNKTGMILVENI